MTISGLDKIIEKINSIKCIHNIEMLVDTRELKLLDYIKNVSFVKIKQLDIGDIHYLINDKVVFIIERKTFEDLSNSIKDGRFREQKVRLQKCLSQNIDIIYLIEGDIRVFKDTARINKRALYSSLLYISISLIFTLSCHITNSILSYS